MHHCKKQEEKWTKQCQMTAFSQQHGSSSSFTSFVSEFAPLDLSSNWESALQLTFWESHRERNWEDPTHAIIGDYFHKYWQNRGYPWLKVYIQRSSFSMANQELAHGMSHSHCTRHSGLFSPPSHCSVSVNDLEVIKFNKLWQIK